MHAPEAELKLLSPSGCVPSFGVCATWGERFNPVHSQPKWEVKQQTCTQECLQERSGTQLNAVVLSVCPQRWDCWHTASSCLLPCACKASCRPMRWSGMDGHGGVTCNCPRDSSAAEPFSFLQGLLQTLGALPGSLPGNCRIYASA